MLIGDIVVYFPWTYAAYIFIPSSDGWERETAFVQPLRGEGGGEEEADDPNRHAKPKSGPFPRPWLWAGQNTIR